jgi:sugar/nucleoside kinase (ribokinase family)
MSDPSIDLVGVGSPIVDTLVRVDESFLASVPGEKGGMVLVEAETIAEILARLTPPFEESPGGAAGNTTFAAARLGLRTAFVGKVGDDVPGRFYLDRFAALGGDPSRFVRGQGPNGRCLSLVTPDGARTLRTHLGVAATLRPEEVTPAAFAGCRHAHIEGYLLFNDALMQAVLEAARAAGCTLSLDLGSFEVVRAAGKRLEHILREFIEIVFANEDEAAALLGEGHSHATLATRLGEYCPIAALKLGAEGAILSDREGILHPIAAFPVANVVDTTGAGDLWAAGFLYGWLKGRDLATCGHYGSFIGAEVVQVMGTVLPDDRWSDIFADFRGRTAPPFP